MKCSQCKTEGFANPAAIKEHRKTCAVINNEGTLSYTVEEQAANAVSDAVAVDSVIPSVAIPSHMQMLQQLYSDMKSQEGKQAVSRCLARADLFYVNPQELFDSIYAECMDGDDRAALRRIFHGTNPSV